MDLQRYVVCLQQDNYTIIQACETLYQCGMSICDWPRGRNIRLSVIDKIDPDTHLESATAPLDWCSEVIYHEVDFCHVHRYRDTSIRSGGLFPMGAFFGLPFCGFRPPVPTDAGLPAGLAPLDLGLHYSQTSTDRTHGRAGAGIWAKDRGKIYVAPWLQTTESVILKWDGLKRTWNDADPVDQDPDVATAIDEYVRWKHAAIFDHDDAAAATAEIAYNTARANLIRECREETRTRGCEGSSARQASTLGSSTTALYYNDEQSASATCPDGTTGSPTSVTIPAGTVGSNVSVTDANQKALAQAQSQAQAQLSCVAPPVTYWNVARTVTASCQGEDGAPTPSGNTVTVTVPANTVSSTVSQDDANSQADALGLSQAQSKLSCTFYNKETTYKASCPANTSGPDQTATVPAGTYSSTDSQATADQLALTDAIHQVNVLLAGSCSAGGGGGPYYNTIFTVTAQAFSSNCPNPLGGVKPGIVTVTVTIPPAAFSSSASVADANLLAQATGQAFAQNLANTRASQGQCGNHSTVYPNP